MIKVILADHERIFRVGMATALAAEDDIRIVGQPNTPEQLLHGVENFRPHVLVLSSSYLAYSDAIRQACTRRNTAILLLEDYREPATKLAQSNADFHGVIRRSADEATVVQCIRHLARGGRVLRLVPSPPPPELENESIGERVRQRLTPHELRVVSYVVQGYKNREIALRVGSTEQGVKNALRKIFNKTGVFGRLELALFVLHHRILVTSEGVTPLHVNWNSIAQLRKFWDTGRRFTIN